MSEYSKIAKLAAQWWGKRLMQGDKEKFVSVLQALIEKQCEERVNKYPDSELLMRLGVDYDPCPLLLEALHIAGIHVPNIAFSAEGILPMKHLLHIYKDKLLPREGYQPYSEEIHLKSACRTMGLYCEGCPDCGTSAISYPAGE